MATKTRKSLPNKNKDRKSKTRKKKGIKITHKFESGNCKIINIYEKDQDNIIVTLTKKHEPYPVHLKRKYENWFYFKVSNCKNKKIIYKFKDMKYYQNNFNGFNVCYSYDNKIWKRTPTTTQKNSFIWDFTSKKNNIWFAYYVPYTTKRKNSLMNGLKRKSKVKYKVLGFTPLRRKIDMLSIGEGDKHIFFIARQHPGETVGSFMAEGLLKEFFSPKNKNKRNKFMKRFTINIVPMANPDGVFLGHWYTNHAGCNLNRNWQKIHCHENKMISENMGYEKYGSLYIDLHGDEGCDNHFITQCSPENKIYQLFNKTVNKIGKNWQLHDHYAKERKGKKNMFGIWGTYDCKWLDGMTIEACMKHPMYNHSSLEQETLRVGADICKTLFKLHNEL